MSSTKNDDICGKQTASDVEKYCGRSKADNLRNNCPSNNVTAQQCYKKCLQNDKGNCRGFSTKWTSEYNQIPKYLDKDGKCINITEECPNKQYRDTPGGKCKDIPQFLTCGEYIKKNPTALKYSWGEVLDNQYFHEPCPQSQCNPNICKGGPMTCKEKKDTYSDDLQNVCGGADVNEDKIVPLPTPSKDEIKKQFVMGGACCHPPPICSKYANRFDDSEDDLRLCEGDKKAIENHNNCSTFTTETECRDNGCHYESGTCKVPPVTPSTMNYEQFKKYCCVKPTCKDYRDGFCRGLSQNGLIDSSPACENKFDLTTGKKWIKLDKGLLSSTYKDYKYIIDNTDKDNIRNTPKPTPYEKVCMKFKTCGVISDDAKKAQEKRIKNLQDMFKSETNWCKTFTEEPSCIEHELCKWNGTSCSFRDSSDTPSLHTQCECLTGKSGISGCGDTGGKLLPIRPEQVEECFYELTRDDYDGGEGSDKFCARNYYYYNKSGDIEPQSLPQVKKGYIPNKCVSLSSSTSDNICSKHTDKDSCIDEKKIKEDIFTQKKFNAFLCQWQFNKSDGMYGITSSGLDESNSELDGKEKKLSTYEFSGCCRPQRCSDLSRKFKKDIDPLSIKRSNKMYGLCGDRTNNDLAFKPEATCPPGKCTATDCCKPLTCGDFKRLFNDQKLKFIGPPDNNGKPPTSPEKFDKNIFTCGDTNMKYDNEIEITPGPLEKYEPPDVSVPPMRTLKDYIRNIKTGVGVNKSDHDKVEQYISKLCCGDPTCRLLHKANEHGCRDKYITGTVDNITVPRGKFKLPASTPAIQNMDNWTTSCCTPHPYTCSEISQNGNCPLPKVNSFYNTTGNFEKECLGCKPGVRDAKFVKNCCENPKDNQKCTGNPDNVDRSTCWISCNKNEKAHSKYINPKEDNNPLKNQVCRPAFGYKKFESNFKNIDNAKSECKLKMFRELGECNNETDPSRRINCKKQALSKTCSVSKNDGDNNAPSEPGSCSSFAWDIGVNQERKSSKLYGSTLNIINNDFPLNPPHNLTDPMKVAAEELPFSFEADDSIIQSVLSSPKANPIPARFFIPSNDDITFESNMNDYKFENERRSLPETSVGKIPIIPSYFSAPLRAWQGYRSGIDTGSYTSVIDGFTGSRNLIEGLAPPTDSQTQPAVSRPAHPLGGKLLMKKAKYGLQTLDSKCYASSVNTIPGQKTPGELTCNDIVLNFTNANLTDNERRTQQCPQNKYYDITKGNKKLVKRPDGPGLPPKPPNSKDMVQISDAFDYTCCSSEHKICEKYNPGIKNQGGSPNDYDATDIFDLFSQGKQPPSFLSSGLNLNFKEFLTAASFIFCNSKCVLVVL